MGHHAQRKRKPRKYQKRRPEKTVLYQVVQEHLETLLAEGRSTSEYGLGYPKYVEQEFRKFLECGLLQHGFARLVCEDCGHEDLLAFSCKGRSVCPSCVGRKMANTAAHLVDSVMPPAPYRLWTLSLPKHIRWKLVRDPTLLSKVLIASLRVVFTWQRRKARDLGVIKPLPGAISFIQRFGSLLQVNVHFHCWLPDGVFYRTPLGELAFKRIEPPTGDELEVLLDKIRRRVLALCDEDVADPDDDDLAVAEAQRLSIELPTPRLSLATRPPENTDVCSFDRGFSLHAGVFVEAHERAKLERLLRYGMRPPYAQKRLSRLPDGRVKLKLRKPYYTGQTVVLFEPVDFLRRLAAIIPPPRQNLLRYHGVFAPNAAVRRDVALLAQAARLPCGELQIAPQRAQPAQVQTRAQNGDTQQRDPSLTAEEPAPASSYRLLWADLLRRTFEVDATVCPKCDGRLRLRAVIKKPDAIVKILAHLGLPTEIPQIAAARPPPQLAFDDVY